MESRPSQVEVATAVDLVVRLGSIMLSAGSPTDDVERSMRVAARAMGLGRVTAGVSFGSITLAYTAGPDAQPATAMQMVRERVSDYRRLSAAARLVNELRTGEADRERAATEVERIEGMGSAWPEPLTSLAQALSASASTVIFGGSALDALATFIIGVLVQPIVVRLDRSGLPPFFRSLIGPLMSSLLVAGAVAIGSPINAGLVMTGSLLRFLPGSALVAGMRDLIDQSIISGTARLAEALFLGAAVAVGIAIGTGVASMLNIALTLTTSGTESYQAVVQIVAAGIACGAWAVRLGEPRFALLAASALGALGWAVYVAAGTLGIGAVSATACAGLVVGAAGRYLARRHEAPVVLWVVPASLPLLPGLLIVGGMLASDAIDGLLLLSTAVVTALVVGASVAFGDIVVQTLRQVREEIIQPVIIQPVVQVVHTRMGAVFGARSSDRTTRSSADEEEPMGGTPRPAARSRRLVPIPGRFQQLDYDGMPPLVRSRKTMPSSAAPRRTSTMVPRRACPAGRPGCANSPLGLRCRSMVASPLVLGCFLSRSALRYTSPGRQKARVTVGPTRVAAGRYPAAVSLTKSRRSEKAFRPAGKPLRRWAAETWWKKAATARSGRRTLMVGRIRRAADGDGMSEQQSDRRPDGSWIVRQPDENTAEVERELNEAHSEWRSPTMELTTPTLRIGMIEIVELRAPAMATSTATRIGCGGVPEDP